MQREVIDFIGRILDEDNPSITLGYYVMNLNRQANSSIEVTQLPDVAAEFEFRNVEWLEQSKSIRVKQGFPDLHVFKGRRSALGLTPSVPIGISEEPIHEEYLFYTPRNALQDIISIINKPFDGYVYAVYGLRRTGKTVMLQQAFAYCNEQGIPARFFTISPRLYTTFKDLTAHLDKCVKDKIRVVFIDEITFITDFQQNSAWLADIYAANLKVIISGTHSLGLHLANGQGLYRRIQFIDTSYLSFKEFKKLFPERTLHDYIRTACELGGDSSAYTDSHSFIQSSIVENIIHSYRHSMGFSGCSDLQHLDASNDLQTLITRIIEGYSSHITVKALNKEFRSHIFGCASTLATLHGESITPDRRSQILSSYKDELSIKTRLSEEISENTFNTLCRYLTLIGVLARTDVKYSDSDNVVICQQWGLVYACALKLLAIARMDTKFCDIVINDVEGRLLEQILGFETALARKTYVYKNSVLGKEIDFVVDLEGGACAFYEVKHSSQRVASQAKNFPPDNAVLGIKLVSKNIIYLGKSVDNVKYILDDSGAEVTVNYINAEEYLLGLYDD